MKSSDDKTPQKVSNYSLKTLVDNLRPGESFELKLNGLSEGLRNLKECKIYNAKSSGRHIDTEKLIRPDEEQVIVVSKRTKIEEIDTFTTEYFKKLPQPSKDSIQDPITIQFSDLPNEEDHITYSERWKGGGSNGELILVTGEVKYISLSEAAQTFDAFSDPLMGVIEDAAELSHSENEDLDAQKVAGEVQYPEGSEEMGSCVLL